MRPRIVAVWAPWALWFCLSAATAHAGGQFFTARGARPLGRAGAFVAGADDLESIYWNPAGLSQTGWVSMMVEAGFFLQTVHYDRIDSGGNALPGVSGNYNDMGLPFLGVSWRPHIAQERLTFAFAVYTPYAGIPRFPADGPQRYSEVSLYGSLMATAELALAVRILPQLYIGFGFQNLFAKFNNTAVTTVCTQLDCAPEDPHFDALTQVTVNSPFTPSGNVGALLVLPRLRVGVAFQLPYWVNASGTTRSRLPSDPLFDGAVMKGDSVSVHVVFPWVLRLGVEVRPIANLRVELAGSYEAWQMENKVTFVPHGISVDNIVMIGSYTLKPTVLDRSMTGVFSISLGGEYDLLNHRLVLRAGYMFETNSIPNATLSVLTPDGNKHLLSCGVGVRIGKKVRLDVSYGHVIQPDRTVTNSRSMQLAPFQPDIAVAVGNGTYKVQTDVLAIGIETRF